jgi:prepilin-type N-terminal cleavage/methylation domain-containing protein
LKKIYTIGDKNMKSLKKRGFTLIELLITIMVFSIVITGFLALFSSAFENQRKSLAQAHLLNSASYLTEYISRALRMAKKDLTGSCITLKYNYENPGGDSSKIRFLNYNDECQEFFLQNGVLKVKKSGVTLSLTPSNLTVESLKFEISGESQNDQLQPRVTFALKLKTSQQPSQIINLQTTISQRDLDVAY